MTDIVERLRDAQAHFEAVIIEGSNSYLLDMCKEAADEITRLRNALAAEREACAQVLDVMQSEMPAPRSYEHAHFCMGLEAGAAAIRARGET